MLGRVAWQPRLGLQEPMGGPFLLPPLCPALSQEQRGPELIPAPGGRGVGCRGVPTCRVCPSPAARDFDSPKPRLRVGGGNRAHRGSVGWVQRLPWAMGWVGLLQPGPPSSQGFYGLPGGPAQSRAQGGGVEKALGRRVWLGPEDLARQVDRGWATARVPPEGGHTACGSRTGAGHPTHAHSLSPSAMWVLRGPA